jgi:DNA-binding SARP family transcriptional activator
MSVLRICLFGTIQVSHDGYPIRAKITPKAQTLFAYLLLCGRRYHNREILANLLWHDYTEKRARGSLNTTLWRLRRALEPEDVFQGTYILTSPTDEIGFNWESEHWLDVVVFENQAGLALSKPVSAAGFADIQRLENTLQLYTGELLEGFYDDWVIREQERLNCLYLNSLEYLMRYYHHCAEYEKSLLYGQRILAQEPIRESIHREIMRLYLETGQRALAVHQYEICREVLAKELNLPPMEETQALYAQALQGQGRATTSSKQPDKVQEVLNQLNLATRNFDNAQQQLRLARQKFDQTQHELQHALRLVEQLTKK